MQLRRSQQIGKLLEKNIRLFEEYLSIEEMRKKTGYAKTLDVLAVEAKLAIAKAEMPLSYGNIYQSIYAISVLTGEKPESLLSELLPIKDLPALPEEVAIGLRSDLIRRRPDINSAERALAAATDYVGVAVANFLPSFTLAGDIGFQSLKFANLFSGMSKTWTIGGDVNMPLFQGGRLIGNLRLTESQAVSAAYNYQQAVLTALQEVETALVQYKCDAQTLLEFRSAAEKDAASLDITEQQHKYGYVDEVARIQSSLGLNTSLGLEMEARELALKDLIILYKALGGGFEPFPLEK
jgi:NodT family efflux transporter outer membrane factor (OMF) lipoprotein